MSPWVCVFVCVCKQEQRLIALKLKKNMATVNIKYNINAIKI